MVEKKKKTRSTSSSVDPATQYARDVDSGKEIAGPDIRNSCKRHLKDLESCHARGLVWDVAAAQRAIDFFAKVLKLNGGEHEGKPFYLLPWQCFIVGSIFGWKNSDDYRRYRMAYVESGRATIKRRNPGCGCLILLSYSSNAWMTAKSLLKPIPAFDGMQLPLLPKQTRRKTAYLPRKRARAELMVWWLLQWQ